MNWEVFRCCCCCHGLQVVKVFRIRITWFDSARLDRNKSWIFRDSTLNVFNPVRTEARWQHVLQVSMSMAPKMSPLFTINSSARGLSSSCESWSFESYSFVSGNWAEFFMTKLLRISKSSTYQLSWSKGSNHGMFPLWLQNPTTQRQTTAYGQRMAMVLLYYIFFTACTCMYAGLHWNQSKFCKMKKCSLVITFQTNSNLKIFVRVTYTGRVLWPVWSFKTASFWIFHMPCLGSLHSYKDAAQRSLHGSAMLWPINLSALDCSSNVSFKQWDHKTFPQIRYISFLSKEHMWLDLDTRIQSNGCNHTATPLSKSIEKWWSESRIGSKLWSISNMNRWTFQVFRPVRSRW